MAQGKGKINKLPGGIKQKQKRQKPMGLKKGGRVIAPKKTRHIEAAKLKRGLEKSINAKIEHDITMTANSVEPKNFNLTKAKDATTSNKSAKT